MKIIIQLALLTLSLLLVNVTCYDEYCAALVDECNGNFTTKCAHQKYLIKTCCELKIFSSPSGVYTLRKDQFENAEVYCNMDTAGGGWNVIQRNKQGSLLGFNRDWDAYTKGFGNLESEFWYGLDGISCLTQNGDWEMRIDIQKSDRTWTYFHYNTFKVGSANDGFPLTIGGYTLQSTDHFGGLNGMKFSTKDVDNEKSRYNCAATYASSGWWYYTNCHSINLNRQPPLITTGYTALSSEMKIRPKRCLINSP